MEAEKRRIAIRDSKPAGLRRLLSNPWMQGILLVAAVLALYWRSLFAGFVWDAGSVILTNTYVHSLRNLPDVLTLRVMHLDVIDNNRPVFLLSAILDWMLWGPNPFGWHLTNVLLHALVAVLLFSWMKKLMTGVTPWVPFFVALLFAVHPVNCEVVAEVSYRKDLIAAAGILAALNLAVIFQPVYSVRNLLTGSACVACLVIAVGTKENAFAGPFVLGCYWFLFRRNEPRRGWIILGMTSLLAVTAFMVARFTLPPWPSIIFTEKPQQLGGSFSATLQIQPRIWAFYFRQMIWPVDLCADYRGYSIRNFSLGAAVVALLLILAGQICFAAKNRVACLGFVFFWLSLLPVSNFIPIYRPMADRFLYLPMCALALMAAALAGVVEKMRTRAAGTVACAIICALAAATFTREKVWQNNYELWKDTVARDPVSFTALNNLAEELLNRGDFAGAITTAEKAIRISNGQNPNPFATAAVALNQLGRTADADAAYRKAVKLDARYRNPESLVKALIFTGDEARRLEVIARRNL